MYKHNITIEGKEYEVEILDVSGNEDDQVLIDFWINFGEGFILLFDITYKESFDILKEKYHRIIKGKHNIEVPIFLVGNKIDLESERKVSFEEAAEFTNSLKIQYIEVSAYQYFNCQKTFEILSLEILMFNKGKYIEYKKNIKKKRKNNINNLPSLLKFNNY